MSWMLERLHTFGSKEVFISLEDHCSYLELHSKVTQWLEELSNKKVEKGDVVSVVGDFDVDTAALIIALIINDNIVVPLTSETKNNHNKFYDIANVDCSFNFEKGDCHFSRRKVTDYHNLVLSLKAKSTGGLILFTSGTTGESKGVVLDASTLLERFKHHQPKPEKALRSIVFLKLDHIGGLNTLFSVVFSGGTAISIKNRVPKDVCEIIEKYKVELLPTTPTFLNMLLLSDVANDYDVSSLKVITYGTEPMPLSTLTAMNEKFPSVKLKQTYGLTELGIFSTRSKSSDSDWLEIGGEGVTTKVVDEVLYIKTTSCMLGYLNAPSPFTEDGFYITGDRVQVDGQYFRILGRDSEIINVGGEKVYPAEIENVLLEMPNVLEVLVTGKKNPIMGNVVCASFVLKEHEDKKDLMKRVYTYCKHKLEPFKVPKIISISNESFMSARLKKARNKPVVESE